VIGSQGDGECAAVDLSVYKDCGMGTVSVTAGSGVSRVCVPLLHGPNPAADLVFNGVAHFAIDYSGFPADLVFEITARALPRYGPWPPEARHLLHHHDNNAELTWVILDGTTRIEVLAELFVVETACGAAK
jgi:hypothetical protein